MSLSLRLGTLGAVGVLAAGLAHAGWLWLSWAGSDTAGGVGNPWLALLAQGSWTVVLALAVAWQLRRSFRPLQQSLELLRQQADALEQGRFMIVGDPPAPEAAPLARSLNTAVRRLQSAIDEEGSNSGIHALRRTARRDPQTGLDSRYTFLARLTERLGARAGQELALLAVRLLPRPGEASPDATTLAGTADLLRLFAQRIPGAFVGRLSESELVLCLPAHGVVGDSAQSLMAALGSAGERPRCVIACVDQLGGASLGGALAQLERALDQAELGGAGQIESRCAQQEAAGALEDAQTRRQIVEATRTGAMQLAEFPVIDAQGQVLHLECPMRLQLTPGEPAAAAEAWLPVATRYRLTTQIDLAGIELALAAAAQDRRSRCVHVAAESLAAAGFLSAVRARLQAAPEAAARLWIEIAEVSLERLPPRLRSAGTVWRRCGARVGIEHAGAALRSLARLPELELDYVKVDAAFVRGLAGDAAQRERALGLVALAHEMGALVIAEGVDERPDLDALWALGFDGATGRAATRALRAPDEGATDAVEPVNSMTIATLPSAA